MFTFVFLKAQFSFMDEIINWKKDQMDPLGVLSHFPLGDKGFRSISKVVLMFFETSFSFMDEIIN